VSKPIEPRRLLEEASSPVERALLEAGTSYRSSAAVHAKTLAAVGLAGTAVVTEAAGASLWNLGWSKWLTSLSIVGATAAIPAAYYVLRDEPAAVVQPSPPPPQKRPAPLANARLSVAPVVEAPPAADTAAPAAAAPPAAESRAATRQPTLAEEVDALDRARAALSRGDSRAALQALDAYGRAYPRGRLALEAEVLRIDALDKSGQSAGARRRAERFLRQNPQSVLASRVRRILAR
jgi:hypothetical protein